MYFTAAIALLAFAYVQPEGTGFASMGTLVSYVAIGAIALVFALLSRKQMMPYINLEALVQKASETPLSAAVVVLAVCHLMASLVGLFGGQIR